MEKEAMNTIILQEFSTVLSLAESWEHSCAVWMDRPLTTASSNLAELTGEFLLDELPPLEIQEQDVCHIN
jgi:hypothetical protein